MNFNYRIFTAQKKLSTPPTTLRKPFHSLHVKKKWLLGGNERQEEGTEGNQEWVGNNIIM
jgi:hypothetical protein